MQRDLFCSIDCILAELAEHPLLEDVSRERVITSTVQFMQILNMPQLFASKEAVIEIKDYRGALPCDYYKMQQVLLSDEDGCKGSAFNYSTDTFNPVGSHPNSELTYKIQGNIILTTIKNGHINISYLAMPVDDNGVPMIIDNESFKRALVSFIKKGVFTILFDLGRINPNSYQQALQDYAFNVANCQASLNTLSIGELNSLANMNNSLNINLHDHESHYRQLSRHVKYRRH